MNDPNGNISTCNSTNLFFVKDDTVWTSTGQFCLNGITRGKALFVCRRNGIICNESNFTFADIEDCEEAFVTGTFAGIIPVSKIEGRLLKSTHTNSLVNKIKDLYNQHINQYIINQ